MKFVPKLFVTLSLFSISVALIAQDDDIIAEEGYVLLNGMLAMDGGQPVFISYTCATPGTFKIDAKGDKKSAKQVKGISKALSGGALDEVTLSGKLYVDEMVIAPKKFSLQMPPPSCMTDVNAMGKYPAHVAYASAVYALYIHNIELVKAFRFFSVISEETFDEELGENVSVVRCYNKDCREIDCQAGKAANNEAWEQIDLQLKMINEILKPQIEMAQEQMLQEKETLEGLDAIAAKLVKANADIMSAKNMSTLPKILKARKESREAMKMVKDQ